MKKTKIIFWITTGFIFLFEGDMPALTGNTEIAVEGVRHLGYPDYFRVALNIFKIIGVLLLIIPQTPSRVKELAYAGFAFNFIFATISHISVDGVTPLTFLPIFVFAVLIASYLSYHKLQGAHE